MQNLQKVYGTMNRFVYNIRNFQTDNKAVKDSVEIMQNLRILHETMYSFVWTNTGPFVVNETNDDSAGTYIAKASGILRNYSRIGTWCTEPQNTLWNL
jgi:hypothetical protein